MLLSDRVSVLHMLEVVHGDMTYCSSLVCNLSTLVGFLSRTAPEKYKQEQHWVWHYTPDKGIYMGSHLLLSLEVAIKIL